MITMKKKTKKPVSPDVKIYTLLSLLDEAMGIAAEAIILLEEESDVDPETILNFNNRYEALAKKGEEELDD